MIAVQVASFFINNGKILGEIEHLKKSFGSNKVLKDISFKIEKGRKPNNTRQIRKWQICAYKMPGWVTRTR